MSQQLRISPNQRRILQQDGSPFFYMGDTAWHLFHFLTREDANLFLTTRSEQKYNVIQSVILVEKDGLRTPNAYGHTPLIDMDPTRPNEAYFEHIDYVLRLGASKGLWWGLLPTWGDKWNSRWGIGPEIFTPENARIYGEWLGKRYRDEPIIWIVGGDRAIENPRHLEINRALAEGLRAGDGGNHLITFHPCGGTTSSDFVHDEPWLDFNMLQSGHESSRLGNQGMVLRDYHRAPCKPCLDGEPAYENHPDMAFKRDEPAPYLGELTVRRAAYQAVFAGACGHTYGCHDVWQFYDGAREPVNRSRTPWKEAIHLPGARQMQHLRRLVESMPFEQLLPCRHLASSMPSSEPVQALRSDDNKTALIYFPTPGARSVQLGSLEGNLFQVSWFAPRTGEITEVGTVPTCNFHEWTPPAGESDWVLTLRSA